MYCPKPFAVNDVALLHRFINGHPFATIAAVIDGAVALAYAPVLLDGDGIGEFRFHLAKNNSVAAVPDGTTLTFSFLGPDAYVSPDWYVVAGLVPTWNYAAVEAKGVARRLSRDELRKVLGDISAEHEGRLAPKPAWTMDKVPPDKIEVMLNAIVGFAAPILRLEGKFKLSQDKKAEDIAGVIAALEAMEDGRAHHVAAGMRRWSLKAS